MTFKEYLDLLESNPEKRAVSGIYGSLYPGSYGTSYRGQYPNKIKVKKKQEDAIIDRGIKIKKITPNYDKSYLFSVEDETKFFKPGLNDTKWTSSDHEETQSVGST